MRLLTRFLPAALVALPLSCNLDDSKRCDEGFVYEGGYCMLVDTDTDSETDSDSETADAGVTGLGEICTGQDDCEGYDADYCAMEIGATDGQCTVSDCIAEPDDCPPELYCCDFPATGMTAGMPNLCIPEEQYETYSNLGMCDG
jgi:hypothetical protein